MTNRDTGHGGHDQLRAELETALAERDQALSELAELKARLTAQAIVTDSTAAQPLPPPRERHLRLIQGGAVVAALLAGVEWLRRHREIPVALVVAGVAAVAGWLLWPDPGSRPSGEPPPAVATVTETSVSPFPTPPPTATPTPSIEPTVGPTRSPTPTSSTSRSLAPTSRPTGNPTTGEPTALPERTTAQPTAVPTMRPTTVQPTTEPTPTGRGTLPTPPPSTRPPAARPTCVHLHIPNQVGACLPPLR